MSDVNCNNLLLLQSTIILEEKRIMKITAHHVDAFSSEPFGGNPTVVITEADVLSGELMRRIADEVYLSEATFIMRPAMEGCQSKFRFFTPSEEYNMSVHSSSLPASPLHMR